MLQKIQADFLLEVVRAGLGVVIVRGITLRFSARLLLQIAEVASDSLPHLQEVLRLSPEHPQAEGIRDILAGD